MIELLTQPTNKKIFFIIICSYTLPAASGTLLEVKNDTVHDTINVKIYYQRTTFAYPEKENSITDKNLKPGEKISCTIDPARKDSFKPYIEASDVAKGTQTKTQEWATSDGSRISIEKNAPKIGLHENGLIVGIFSSQSMHFHKKPIPEHDDVGSAVASYFS